MSDAKPNLQIFVDHEEIGRAGVCGTVSYRCCGKEIASRNYRGGECTECVAREATERLADEKRRAEFQARFEQETAAKEAALAAEKRAQAERAALERANARAQEIALRVVELQRIHEEEIQQEFRARHERIRRDAEELRIRDRAREAEENRGPAADREAPPGDPILHRPGRAYPELPRYQPH